MTTITISRELGANGEIIARQVAETLGYQFIDKRIIENVFRRYGLTKFDDVYDTAPSWWDITNPHNLLIIAMLNETMEALAHRGNVVILGRGGFASLSEYTDVLSVRVQAPFTVRVDRVMKAVETNNRAEVESRLRADDVNRRGFVKMFYNKEWDAESYFNLVIDTYTASTDLAVKWIIEAASALANKTPTNPATAAVVDSVLLDAIAEALADVPLDIDN